jgi:hypothetical protein
MKKDSSSVSRQKIGKMSVKTNEDTKESTIQISTIDEKSKKSNLKSAKKIINAQDT